MHLDALRSFANTLGGPWMPRLPYDLQHLLEPDVDVDPERVSRVQEELCQVPCLVLAFDFIGDLSLVDILLPATAEELISALQVCRPERHRHHLPALLPVLPQPLDGVAVFVAAPSWHPLGHGICLDLTRNDHRLYVTFAPEYVDSAELLQIADLPAGPDFTVWSGPDLRRLEPGTRIHTFPGMLIQIVPADVEPEIPFTLGQLLLLRHAWGAAPSLPVPGFGTAYCLAHRGQGQLHIPDPRYPARYRQDIAVATGVQLTQMRLYASAPRPQHISINGVPCRTVLAVADGSDLHSSNVWHLAVLDCRFLEMGWCAATVVNGMLDIGLVLDEFNNHSPLGWHTILLGGWPQSGHQRVAPGQVLVLAYAQDSETTTGSGITRHSEEAHTQGPGNHEAAETITEDEPSQHDLATSTPLAAQGAATRTTPVMHFVLVSPAYASEHLAVELDLPATEPEAIQAITEQREASGHCRFPRPILAPMQPALPFACVLTVPDWIFVGVPVLIICHVLPFRVLTEIVPATLQISGILHLAGVQDPDAQVYVQNVPWAYGPDQWVHVTEGVLFTMLPARQPFISPLPLALILTEPLEEQGEPVLPGPFAPGVWLLTELANLRFGTATHPTPPLHTAVARSLGFADSDMTLVPTTPAVRDHSHQGQRTRPAAHTASASMGVCDQRQSRRRGAVSQTHASLPCNALYTCYWWPCALPDRQPLALRSSRTGSDSLLFTSSFWSYAWRHGLATGPWT